MIILNMQISEKYEVLTINYKRDIGSNPYYDAVDFLTQNIQFDFYCNS